MAHFRTAQFFKATTEDWHPSYILRIAGDESKDMRHPELLLCVSFSALGPKQDTWRVSVWGADDHGMEFDTPDFNTAREKFHMLAELSVITGKILKDIGFIPA